MPGYMVCDKSLWPEPPALVKGDLTLEEALALAATERDWAVFRDDGASLIDPPGIWVKKGEFIPPGEVID